MSGASPPLAAAAAAADEENEQQQKTKTNQLVAGSYSMALIRALEFAGVKFLRYHALDVANSARCKVKPLKMLKMSSSSSSSSILNLDLDNQVCIAKVCFGGLPNFCDVPSPDCGLTAKGSLVLVPDLSTLRILPYAPDSAMVLCNLREQDSGKKTSDLCTRSLLQRIASRAAKEHQIAFNVGVEIEFCLYDRKTNQPVDVSKFSNTTTLNQQQGFLADLYHQLERQEIDVELIHAESAHGQLEIVLQYCRGDPVEMADKVVLCRETIVNVARLHGLKALFLPKIDPNGAGNGSHVHLSFIDVETGRNLFPNNKAHGDDDEESLSSNSNRGAGRSFFLGSLPKHGISEKGRSFMEGILQHLPALLALTIPTANSFRRGNVDMLLFNTTATSHSSRFHYAPISRLSTFYDV
jgi:glutamine synthetase